MGVRTQVTSDVGPLFGQIKKGLSKSNGCVIGVAGVV